MSNEASSLSVTLIPVADISDPEWNSRLNIADDKELAALAESIDQEGLQAPIKVEAGSVLVKSGKERPGYTLIFGSRRLHAVRKLGWDTIPAFVSEQTTRLNRVTLNIAENLNRKDLSSFEIARALNELREENKKAGEKVTVEQIGKQIGMTAARVSQLTVAYATLPGDIKDHWKTEGLKNGEVKVLDSQFLQELVALKDPDKQLKAFKERRDAIKAATDKGGKKAATKAKKDIKKAKSDKYVVPMDRYKRLSAALKEAKTPKLTMLVVEFLVGKIDSVPGIIDDSDSEGKDKGKKSK